MTQAPDDAYLLQTGLGGALSVLAGIRADGSAAMGFHADPGVLRHDPYSGDHGIGFFGAALLSGSYVLRDPLQGGRWACYLCDLLPPDQAPPAPAAGGWDWAAAAAAAPADDAAAERLLLVPRDAYHRRLFLAHWQLSIRQLR